MSPAKLHATPWTIIFHKHPLFVQYLTISFKCFQSFHPLNCICGQSSDSPTKCKGLPKTIIEYFKGFHRIYIYGHSGHLGHLAWTILYQYSFHDLALIGQTVSEENMLNTVDHSNIVSSNYDDQRPEANVYFKLTLLHKYPCHTISIAIY